MKILLHKKNTKEVNTNQYPLNIYSAAINCGYGQYAPRCSLCKLAHRTEDDSYNSWCGGHCYFDQQDGQCKIKGRLTISRKSNCMMRFFQHLKKHTSKFVYFNIR